ncbi:hypothetical protein [Actinomadura rugatobispora]|uniref:FeoB-associated Cys-rich membrane protein n=1 Tax=Actinomadura rugatobispora TaxID=1994 RepID=A0ABW0ZPT3_9ACTN|nr:hypothetical protein GCM10010200_035980 [Actinomadura rugatobispora]
MTGLHFAVAVLAALGLVAAYAVIAWRRAGDTLTRITGTGPLYDDCGCSDGRSYGATGRRPE